MLSQTASSLFFSRRDYYKKRLGQVGLATRYLCPEMNASLRHYCKFQSLFLCFIFDIILCFGGISLMGTLCDAYYEKDESH